MVRRSISRFSKGSEHGQSGHHQGQARFLGGYRLLLRRQEEFAHHDRQARQEEVRPGRAQARGIQGIQDQVRFRNSADFDGASRPRFYFQAVFNIGGTDGLISAKATWMTPPASPSATPIRHAMVEEPSESYSSPPP